MQGMFEWDDMVHDGLGCVVLLSVNKGVEQGFVGRSVSMSGNNIEIEPVCRQAEFSSVHGFLRA